MNVVLTHQDISYRFDRLVANTPIYRLYIASNVKTGEEYLAQVANDVNQNGPLDRAAFTLGKLQRKADLFEAKHAESNPEKGRLNYDRLFPNLVVGWKADEEDGRRISILSLKDVEDIKEMVALSTFRTRGKIRADLPSSAWIMGRLLKLTSLAHACDISVNMLGGNNVLLEPSRHFVVVLDWTAAESHHGGIPEGRAASDIAQAARAVFAAIGGNPQTLEYPYNAGDGEPYVESLRRLAQHQEHDAFKAHKEFYELVRSLWGRKFRPLNTLPL